MSNGPLADSAPVAETVAADGPDTSDEAIRPGPDVQPPPPDSGYIDWANPPPWIIPGWGRTVSADGCAALRLARWDAAAFYGKTRLCCFYMLPSALPLV